MTPRIALLRYITLAAVVLIGTGCASRVQERDMNHLASALTKVSAAVDAKVRYENYPASASSEELLNAVAQVDPPLMKNFDGQVLRVLRQGEDSAVLLCEAGPGRALLEDAGCTAAMDVHRWSLAAPQRCEFTLNLKAVCGP